MSGFGLWFRCGVLVQILVRAAHYLAQPFFAMSFGCGTGAAPGALGAEWNRGEFEGLGFGSWFT